MLVGPTTLPLRFSFRITSFKTLVQFKLRRGAATSPCGLTTLRCWTEAGVGGKKGPLFKGVSLTGGGGVVRLGVFSRVGNTQLAGVLV